MPDVEKFRIEGTDYNIVDAGAREQLSGLTTPPLTVSQGLPIRKRKFIIIGDSYSTGHGITTDTWSKYLIDRSAPGSYVSHKGGAGFADSDNSFYDLLNAVDVDDPESFTDVVCCGGWNDADFDGNTIASSIVTFVSLAESKFPNAVVHIGCIGWDADTSRSRTISNVVWEAYQRGCANANTAGMNAHYLSGVECALHSYTLFVPGDGYHPNASGQLYLRNFIFLALQYTTPTFVMGDTTVKYSIRQGSTLHGVINIQESAKNGLGTVCSSGIEITYNSPVTIGAHKTTVIAISSKLVGCVNATPSTAYGSVPVAVSVNGATEELAILVFQKGSFATITGGKALLICPFRQWSNVSSLTIRPWKLTIPLGDC